MENCPPMRCVTNDTTSSVIHSGTSQFHQNTAHMQTCLGVFKNTHTVCVCVHTVLCFLSPAREAAMWELEERHLQEKHQLFKQQLKDQYFMQRHQLLKRHEKVCYRRCCFKQNVFSFLPDDSVNGDMDGASVDFVPETLSVCVCVFVCVCVCVCVCACACRRRSRCRDTTSA